MKPNDFIYGGYCRTRFGGGKEINDEFLKYVANVALKAIASELPDEIQTQEVMENILKVAGTELGGKRVVL